MADCPCSNGKHLQTWTLIIVLALFLQRPTEWHTPIDRYLSRVEEDRLPRWTLTLFAGWRWIMSRSNSSAIQVFQKRGVKGPPTKRSLREQVIPVVGRALEQLLESWVHNVDSVSFTTDAWTDSAMNPWVSLT